MRMRPARMREKEVRGLPGTHLRMRAVALIVAVAVLILRAPVALGQDEMESEPSNGSPEATPVLVVLSNPTGAIVTLRGAYEWVGQTPWRLFRPLDGLYAVEARLPGYETWSGEAVFGPGGILELDIRLSRKSRLKAFARSLLVPGWGQIYSGARTKGSLFLTGELAALVGVVVTNEIYQNKVDDFDSAVRAYQDGRNIDELPALRRKADSAASDADRAYDRRKLAVGVAAGIYALSALDALVFSPSGYAGPSDMSAAASSGEVKGLTLALEPGLRSEVGVRYRW